MKPKKKSNPKKRLALDLYAYIDKDSNKLYLYFSVCKGKYNKQTGSFEPKRQHQLKKGHLTIDLNSSKSHVFNEINGKISELSRNSNHAQFYMFTRQKSIAKELMLKINNQKISGKSYHSHYIYYKGMEFFLEKTNKEFLSNFYKKNDNIVFMDIDTHSENKLKTNAIQISTYGNARDIENKSNPITSERFMFHANKGEFAKIYAEKVLQKLHEYQETGMHVTLNVDINKAEKSLLMNKISKSKSCRNFLGFVDIDNGDSFKIEAQASIISFLERKFEYINNVDKFTVLYTDGSHYQHQDDKNLDLISGAYLLNSSEIDSTQSAKVAKPSKQNVVKSLEAEALGFYLGIKKIIDKGLTDKPISLIVDSDELAKCIKKCSQGAPKLEIKLHCNKDFKNAMLLIKSHNLDLKITVIKSHTSSNDIVHNNNKIVDAIALDAIADELDSQKMEHKIKRRSIG